MYPRLKEYVEIGTCIWDGDCEEGFFVTNEMGDDYEISAGLYDELCSADGTHPLNISEELLAQLKRDGIITTSRFVSEGLVNRYIVISVGKRAEIVRKLCIGINMI